MANTYRWYINSLETLPTLDGYNYYVSKVIWRYNAVNESGYTANIQGITVFNTVNDTPEHPYVQYSALTESEVVTWLDEYANITELQTKLDENINEQMNPIILNLPLPWE